MKTTTALPRRGVREGELAENVFKEISGVCRSLHIITTRLEQLREIPLKSETYERETSLWIDALAS
jgi:hypothetical protein